MKIKFSFWRAIFMQWGFVFANLCWETTQKGNFWSFKGDFWGGLLAGLAMLFFFGFALGGIPEIELEK